MDMKQQISERRRTNRELYNVESKKRLISKFEKRIEVTMINALDAFEKQFGSLWKHGSPWNMLNDKEKVYRRQWNDVRSQILDIGNSNLRSVGWDLSKYHVSYDGYKVSFIVKKGDSNV